MRIGIGYDVHRLTGGRKLMLGGVEIGYHLGLAGHSDADVLLHAIMDAMLGAAGLEDIGVYFPDTDNNYKGISSLKLLKKVAGIIGKEGRKVVNIDSVIIAQEPKVSPYTGQMKEKIAAALDILPQQVGIKATTTEKLGFPGRGEGIAAQSVVLLE
ncbi:MAG: 2-C-methyl-D-erythritol 2,4-cyclodiphosphate synthase [Actinomycetota bacterium]